MKGAKVTRRKTLCKLKDLLNIAQNDLVLFISVSVNLFFLTDYDAIYTLRNRPYLPSS